MMHARHIAGMYRCMLISVKKSHIALSTVPAAQSLFFQRPCCRAPFVLPNSATFISFSPIYREWRCPSRRYPLSVRLRLSPAEEAGITLGYMCTEPRCHCKCSLHSTIQIINIKHCQSALPKALLDSLSSTNRTLIQDWYTDVPNG